jgi:PAS domain S-box-containing protein
MLRAIADAAPDSWYVKDREGRFLFANPAALRILGRPAEQVIGRTEAELLGAAAGERLRATDLRVMEAGVAETVEEEIEGAGGRRVFLSTKGPYRDDRGRVVGVVGVSRDVTGRGEAEEARRLESLGRLAAGVAHHFNNLLTAILGGAEALLRDLDRNRPIDRESVESILQAAARSRDLTRQLLAVARRQVLVPAPVDLNDLVREAEPQLRRLLPESVALEVSLQPDLWIALGDRQQLQQVLLCLAASARDAMPDGGSLLVETANAELDEGVARGLGAAPGPHVRLTVRDSGDAIPPGSREGLFEPFSPAGGRGRAAGLALAAAYGIVRQSKGAIAVDSQPARGAAFHVHLPAAPS